MRDLEERTDTRGEVEISVLNAIKGVCGDNIPINSSMPLRKQMHRLELLAVVDALRLVYIIETPPTSIDIADFNGLVDYVLKSATPREEREDLYDRGVKYAYQSD